MLLLFIAFTLVLLLRNCVKKKTTIIVIEIHLIYLGVDKEREKPSFYGNDIHIADHFRMILMLLFLLSL